ncbi:hypothetical protein JNW90_19900 [Micromonospora sp. STR1s_5]|nr:hypothetical protein [Micromonospora sp. STR1s_5]
MSGYGRTPAGTTVRLVIPAATIVAHGDLQLQVTLPDHPGQTVHIPLVDEHFEPLVEIHPHAPRVYAGQTWRGADGELFFAVRWRRDDGDAGEDYLIAADGGSYYTPEQAAADFGPLVLVGETALVDDNDFLPTGDAVDPQSALDVTAVLPRVPLQEGCTP